MSCEARYAMMRETATNGRASHWRICTHPDFIHAPTVVSVPRQPTIPPYTWDTICTLLRSEDLIDHEQAVYAIIEVIRIHGPQQLPSLPDDLIMHLWSVVLMGWRMAETIPEPHRSILMDRLVTDASTDIRAWMWKQCRSAFGKFAIEQALSWSIPLWMFPDGMAILRNACTTDPNTILPMVAEALRYRTSLEPSYRTAIHSIMRDTLIRTIPIPPVDPSSYLQWIDLVTPVLHADPTLFDVTPGLAQTMFAACTVAEPQVINGALDVLTVVRPYSHPLFLGTMASVLSDPVDITAARKATNLVLESLTFLHDPTPIQRGIEAMIRVVNDPSRNMLQHGAAVMVLQQMMQVEQTAPMILPYLRMMVFGPNSNTPSSVVRELLHTPYAESIADAMIALARSVLGIGEPSSDRFHPSSSLFHTLDRRYDAPAILSHAWRKGTGTLIIDTVQQAAAHLFPSERIRILAPGLYDPQLAPEVAKMITEIHPAKADLNLCHALMVEARPDRRIPHAILPRVVEACLHASDEVTSDILAMIWNTDPSSAIDLHQHLLAQGEQYHERAIRALRGRWGQGFDRNIAALLHSTIQHPTALHRQPTVQAITEVVLDGIGVADGDVMAGVWDHLIRKVADSEIASMIDCLVQRPDIWHGNDPSAVFCLIRSVYTRYASDSSDERYVTITSGILQLLQSRWAWRYPTDVLTMVESILRDTVCRPRSGSIEIMQHVAHVLGTGWGYGNDRAIGAMALSIMDWLDRENLHWNDTSVGQDIGWSLMVGSVARSQEENPISHRERLFATTIRQMRDILERWMHTGESG